MLLCQPLHKVATRLPSVSIYGTEVVSPTSSFVIRGIFLLVILQSAKYDLPVLLTAFQHFACSATFCNCRYNKSLKVEICVCVCVFITIICRHIFLILQVKLHLMVSTCFMSVPDLITFGPFDGFY